MFLHIKKSQYVKSQDRDGKIWSPSKKISQSGNSSRDYFSRSVASCAVLLEPYVFNVNFIQMVPKEISARRTVTNSFDCDSIFLFSSKKKGPIKALLQIRHQSVTPWRCIHESLLSSLIPIFCNSAYSQIHLNENELHLRKWCALWNHRYHVPFYWTNICGFPWSAFISSYVYWTLYACKCKPFANILCIVAEGMCNKEQNYA